MGSDLALFSIMEKIATPLSGVWVITPKVFQDDRGFFFESYSKQKMSQIGITTEFVQDNHSKSIKSTVRGIHFQLPPGQVKLVRCTKGKIWDVVVDLRKKSSTFGQWWGLELSESNFKQFYVPVGFAHGFSVLSDFAEVEYKVSNYYTPLLEAGIAWNDPEIGIDWKVENPILSLRDEKNQSLNHFRFQNPF